MFKLCGRVGRPSVARTLKTAFLVMILSSTLSVATAARAQQMSPEQLSAVMMIINSLLFDEESEIKLELSELNNGSFSIASEFMVSFDQQAEDIEFCFYLNNRTGAPLNSLTFEINGTTLPLVNGENCFSIPLAQQLALNEVLFSNGVQGSGFTVSDFSIEPATQSSAGLASLTRSSWGEREVRKVLKIFAFGGHARESQILEWSNMRPRDAIVEMLNFSEHNLKLSPLAPGEKYTDSASQYGKLVDWQNFISDPASNIPIPPDRRDQYGLDGYNFDDAYNRMITVRGLNPFRQKIGFWETNYHLATNLDASVSRYQMAIYYDLIMEAHEAGLPYKDVMGVAAKSAAAAMQYGHRNNEWNADTMECECNDDFAREIHQLYYGIFGISDPNHEDVTIPETAKMLTGMPVPYISGFGFSLTVDFADGIADEEHHLPPVNIFGQQVGGADAAAKIDNLMPISMQHPESLQNLPIMIISVLADDNLNDTRKNQLRTAWAGMGVNRVLLDFLRGYAISEMFHGPDQIKYLTSHERALYLANKHNLDNLEAYFGGGYYDGRAGRTVGSVISEDFAGDFFRPLHNVFGGQNALEASDSALAFERNYNRLTERERDIRDAVVCEECDLGEPWQKKWETVLPQRSDGHYYVEDVAPWLWNHVVGNMDNYTELERAHLYALLGAARNDADDDNDGDYAFDLNLVMCVIADYQVQESASDAPILDILTDNTWDDYCRVSSGTYDAHELAALNAELSGTDIANNAEIQNVLNQLGQVRIPLMATEGWRYQSGQGLVPDGGANLRKHARERVSSALGFIFTTPFVFAEGQ
ncbi:MAG: hypothetical protein AAF431_12630 [Pseudomonadota bacterium]